MKFSSKLLWPGLVFLLIGANFCVVGVTIFAANSGKSFTFTEPNYYNAAVHWDQTAIERDQSDRCGWITETSVRADQAVIRLNDREGRAVSEAVGQVEYFPLIDPASRTQLNVSTDADGKLVIRGSFNRGSYEFRLRLKTPRFTFVRILRACTGE